MVVRGNEGQEGQRLPTSIREFILVHTCKSLTSLYLVGKKKHTKEELLESLSLQKRFGRRVRQPAQAKAGGNRAATIKPDASVLERAYAVHSVLAYYLGENPNEA